MRNIESVAIGTVSKVDAQLGRIKVKFKWMKPEQESHWAPIASLLAGKKRGARFMPEEHDEVLVAFDRGQYEHPYVVGFLWNDVDKSPDNNQHNRIIVTPGGHELRFEDKTGAKKVIVQTDGKLSVTMDDAKKTIVIQAGGQTVTMDNTNKKIEIKAGGQTITMDDTQQSIVMTGGGRSVTLANGQVKIT